MNLQNVAIRRELQFQAAQAIGGNFRRNVHAKQFGGAGNAQ